MYMCARVSLINDVISVINHTLLSTIKVVIGTLTRTSTANGSTSDSKCCLALQVQVQVILMLLPQLYED